MRQRILKSLIAEYLCIRYAVSVPCYSGILSANEAPKYDEIKMLIEVAGASSREICQGLFIKGVKDVKRTSRNFLSKRMSC